MTEPSSVYAHPNVAYAARLLQLINRLRSPHADKVYVAAGYTKADLIRDLTELARNIVA